MKFSSAFSASAIAASTLITFSTVAFAVSQPKNISANLELQPAQMSETSTQTIAGRTCRKDDILCGWWLVIDDWFS
ncbi:hypothetical protein PseudUWO311_05970 [Pseudanabaena sp. UWO311]|uniref:hypothetical protein n=1 Tax=Pseudanabaena sp. UWO311 TaxID=2487337 RepID=UPI001158E0F9|nr:hypothetical protein [Pseudanabaena sp. UWO311]TYQ27980.1 hypothetical protein PseudUWO311_05970 [Pseudanabaena sp. UWO311]